MPATTLGVSGAVRKNARIGYIHATTAARVAPRERLRLISDWVRERYRAKRNKHFVRRQLHAIREYMF